MGAVCQEGAGLVLIGVEQGGGFRSRIAAASAVTGEDIVVLGCIGNGKGIVEVGPRVSVSWYDAWSKLICAVGYRRTVCSAGALRRSRHERGR